MAEPTNSRVRRTATGLIVYMLGSVMLIWLLLRAVLFVGFCDQPEAWNSGFRVFLTGLHRDACAAIVWTLPACLWLLGIPKAGAGRRWHCRITWIAAFPYALITIFLAFVEYFFFDEFESRFNTVAVDYLVYPHEVFINIWDSYPVGWVLLFCSVLALGWAIVGARLFRAVWSDALSSKRRLLLFGAIVLICAAAASTVRPLKRLDADRKLGEVANNGAISFLTAAWTRHLEYSHFYRTMDLGQAFEKVRSLAGSDRSRFVQSGHSILREVEGDPGRPRLNVVLIIEESFGSEFSGLLGREGGTLTPELDRMSRRQGMLFTNFYASGNRTVRGLEGVLSSFPPLPGDSIVKRDRSEKVETLARTLKRDGYSTVFLYGGRGVFDGMRSYALNNGYERFIEQKHFQRPVFTTIWGVCDEDLLDRTLAECRELSNSGRPFMATVLTVSNHKPYTYPKGRIQEDPDKRIREHAVRYADYSLGRFFRMVQQETFWSNTVFAVVADHGARVYGSRTIPLDSYKIPFLITGPAVVARPHKVGVLGSSLDVAPTLLGLIGRPYLSTFFGQDLLKCREDQGRAFLNHNRDIGVFNGRYLAVLGLKQEVELHQAGVAGDQVRDPTAIPGAEQLLQQTVAWYQVADDLYQNRRFAVPR